MRESVIKYEIVEFKKLDKNIYKKVMLQIN